MALRQTLLLHARALFPAILHWHTWFRKSSSQGLDNGGHSIVHRNKMAKQNPPVEEVYGHFPVLPTSGSPVPAFRRRRSRLK